MERLPPAGELRNPGAAPRARLRKALLLHFAEATAGAVAIVTTIVYVHEVLQLDASAFALAMAAVGLGSSAAALALDRGAKRARGLDARPLAQHLRYHRWASRVLTAGGALLALALLPGMLVPGLGVLLLLWALNGAGQAMIGIPSTGLLAEHSATEERGRAYAAHFALTHLFWLVTYPAAGYLARAVGTPLTFTIAGAVCAAVTVLALVGRGSHRPHRISSEYEDRRD